MSIDLLFSKVSTNNTIGSFHIVVDTRYFDISSAGCHTWAGERTGDAAAGDDGVQKDVIASFVVDSTLVPVGGHVRLRCRVTRIVGGKFVQLSKIIPGTTRDQALTSNLVKEHIIEGINRYSINATELADGGYEFIFSIEGSTFSNIIIIIIIIIIIVININAQ